MTYYKLVLFLIFIICAPVLSSKRIQNGITPDLVVDIRDLTETVEILRKELDGALQTISKQNEIIATLQAKELNTKEDKCNQVHGWWRIDKSCYWFSPDGKQVTYETARAVCQGKGKGSDLAIIDSEEEAEFVARVADFTARESAWWVGCQYNFTVKDFICVNGEVMRYRKWSDGRPTGYNNARCIQLWRVPKAEMTDTQCNQRWSFVCERELKRSHSD